MTKQKFKQLVNSKIVILDGATGSNLQQKGMPVGVCPEQWILEHKDIFLELQRAYVKAGSDILYSPTFTGNRIKLKAYGLETEIERINRELVRLSRAAIQDAERKVYVAGDLTMTGEQLCPIGNMQFDELVDVYKEQVGFLLTEGVDLFVIETMMSLQECRAALLAVKETCDLPVMVTLTFQEDGRTLHGTDPKTALIVMQSMGADAVGVNCSTGPDKMVSIIEEMKRYAAIPLIAKPNAGLPHLEDGHTCFDLGPEEFSKLMVKLVDVGAGIVGGCCGSTPSHIEKLVQYCAEKNPIKFTDKSIRAVTNERNTVEIFIEDSFTVVGERINPTGKKDLQEQLREGKWDMVLEMAEEQISNGAAILDINMGMNGIDEKDRMLEAITELAKTVSAPLCIDTSHPGVMEAALRIYPGRALINSISLEKEKFEKLIPIAKKYGAMFILLPISDDGIPSTLKEKKEIIQTIVSEALKHGMSKDDIIVDGLVTTVGANKSAALEALETIRYCKNEQGVATICGLSNISFGLPERQYINASFLTLAIREGLTMAIANPSQDLLMNTAYAVNMLLNREDGDSHYINRINEHPMTLTIQNKKRHMEKVSHGSDSTDSGVFEAVVKGKIKNIVKEVKKELAAGQEAAEIMESHLIPAINKVGDLFDKQIYFLPQLIGSAETMKTAIEYLEPILQKNRDKKELDTIVMASVVGDVHDIGKNLVTLMLKNYGYRVLDLGKDVPNEKIIQTAKNENASIIGLSALMTTTMMQMQNIVKLAKEEGIKAKIIIGGAVVTESFAREIGADGYSRDAREAVLLVNRLLKQNENSK